MSESGISVASLLLPFGVTAAIAVIAMGFVIRWYGRRLRQAEQDRQAALTEAAESQAALSVAPLGHLAFPAGNGAFSCSATLREALGLTGEKEPTFDHVFGALDQDDAARLATAIKRLRNTGQPFSLSLANRDHTRFFEVDGRRASAAAQGSLGDHVWFRDVTQLRQDLAAARQKRDDYGKIIDALPVPVWTRDDSNALLYCNQTYAEAIGLERQSVIEQSVELAGTALADRSRSLAQQARESGTAAVESHHVVVAGERRLLELSERPLEDEITFGIARDLTGEEEIRDELARHIAAHAGVLETLSSGIAILGPDLRLKFFNSAYAHLWGLDEAFLSGEPHINDILEALRERRRLPEQQDFPAYKQQCIKRYSTLIEPFEELVYIPDGSTLRSIVAPHPFGGVLLLFEDVTDRLALERSYNTLMAVQRETLDNLYEGVAVYGSDGRLKLFNPAFARIWNLDPEFLETEPHVRDVAPRAREFFSVPDADWPRFLEQICITATEPHVVSGRRERADGSVLDIAQVPLPDGASLFTYLDVTDSIRVERALRERNEALETTDRLKSEFIANVSYELRTPLNAIVGFAEILENQFFGELNERQLEYSRAIVESSQRLLTLINDILDLATIEAGYLRLELQSVDVAALLESLRTLGHERARSRGIVFALECDDDVGGLIADERRLKQAMFNLMSNAFKFTPEGGRVTVAAHRRDGEVRLSVTDTGVGIPLDERARVFGKFERIGSHGRQSGAGLGLSLVKSLIELHGGWVELESFPEEGTRVVCHLPLEARMQGGDEAEPNAAEARGQLGQSRSLH